MIIRLKRLMHSTAAQAVVEYAIIIALLSLVGIGTVRAVGTSTNELYNKINNTLNEEPAVEDEEGSGEDPEPVPTARSSSETGLFSSSGSFVDGPRRINAGVTLHSDGNETLTWDISLSLASTVFAGDTGSFSGTLTIAGKSIQVGEEGTSVNINTKKIPVSNMSGSTEIAGLDTISGDVPWSFTGQLRLCNSGTMYGQSPFDETIIINLGGSLAAD